jgi:hypothetical protein
MDHELREAVLKDMEPHEIAEMIETHFDGDEDGNFLLQETWNALNDIIRRRRAESN